jgi:hypothetical protein
MTESEVNMGAWSYEVLSNDSALDMLSDIEDSKNITEDIIKILDEDTCIDEKVLAIEIIDISLNGIDEEILGGIYEYENWFKEIEKKPMNDLLTKAIQNIRYIKEHDDGWVERVKEQRKELLIKIENRLLQSQNNL